MQMQQRKDLFTLNQNLNQIKILLRTVLSLLFAIYSSLIFSKVNIAIIDTGFCSNQLSHKNITIKPFVDMTNSLSPIECNQLNQDSSRFHGQKVINTFVSFYKSQIEINITPVIVYDNKGDTKSAYWKQAVEYVEKNNFDYIISAVGVKDQKLKISNNKTIWFVAAARVSPFISKTDSVFPQNQFKSKNVYLFGSFDRDGYVDRGQLNLDKIRLFTRNDNNEFSGSSYAVGKILGIILSENVKFKLTDQNLPGIFHLKDSR